MTSRTVVRYLDFSRPFSLSAMDEVLQPGKYRVEIDEESVDSMSMLPWRRVATSVHVSANGQTRVIPVSGDEYDRLVSDGGASPSA